MYVTESVLIGCNIKIKEVASGKNKTLVRRWLTEFRFSYSLELYSLGIRNLARITSTNIKTATNVWRVKFAR